MAEPKKEIESLQDEKIRKRRNQANTRRNVELCCRTVAIKTQDRFRPEYIEVLSYKHRLGYGDSLQLSFVSFCSMESLVHTLLKTD